jgi:DNA-binding MarR family transcriptional regulator
MEPVEKVEELAREDAMALAVLWNADEDLTRRQVAERIELPNFDKGAANYRLAKLTDRNLAKEHEPEHHNDGITYSLTDQGLEYGRGAANYVDYDNPTNSDRDEVLSRLEGLEKELAVLQDEVAELRTAVIAKSEYKDVRDRR